MVTFVTSKSNSTDFGFWVSHLRAVEHNRVMRRFSVAEVTAGEIALEADEAHHVRDVLRMEAGGEIEVFDSAGRHAHAVIARCTADEVVVRVDAVEQPAVGGLRWMIASAVPKGPRADWMIEKLSELGTAAFVPLKTDRSVVLPEGQGKHQRWQRLAAESAKQSRRAGVMSIAELTGVDAFVRAMRGAGWFFSTDPQAVSVGEAMRSWERSSQAGRLDEASPRELNFLIGPEGGWTEREVNLFRKAGLTGVSLGDTILRVETAAVAAAVLGATVLSPALAGDAAMNQQAGNNT